MSVEAKEQNNASCVDCFCFVFFFFLFYFILFKSNGNSKTFSWLSVKAKPRQSANEEHFDLCAKINIYNILCVYASGCVFIQATIFFYSDA